jgi:hypothetical protein
LFLPGASAFSFSDVFPSSLPAASVFRGLGACFIIAIWGAIYETKAGCCHFRSCNTGACSPATEWSAANQANKADAQKVVQIITSDKVKTQAYCNLTKLEGQVKAVQQNDTKTVEMLTKQAEALIDKLGPEYFKLMDGLEQVDPKSSEAKEFMSILSELDKRCTK